MASISSFSPSYPSQYPGVPKPGASAAAYPNGSPAQMALAANPSNLASPNRLSAYSSAGQIPQTKQDQMIIGMALFLLGRIQNPPADEAYIRNMGVNPVYRNGQEALQVIRSKNIRVEFGDMGDSPAHAQWVAEQNLIMINQKYRGDASKATLYAIAEAIYHEAGHAAKLVTDPVTGRSSNISLTSPNPADVGDDQSSIQEELDCLALNTLAHRYHEAADPTYSQSNSSSRLIADGVALYSKLFFDPDPAKNALVNRVIEKYGDLDPSSNGHEIPTGSPTTPIANRVLQRIEQPLPPPFNACAIQASQGPLQSALPSGSGFPMAPVPTFSAWA